MPRPYSDERRQSGPSWWDVETWFAEIEQDYGVHVDLRIHRPRRNPSGQVQIVVELRVVTAVREEGRPFVDAFESVYYSGKQYNMAATALHLAIKLYDALEMLIPVYEQMSIEGPTDPTT